jgi:hypothetical protein
MIIFNIEYTEEASNDIDNLFDVITYKYKAPLTAFKHVQGIASTIKKLEHSASIYKIQTRASLQQYTYNPRRVNYKAMAIIYNIINETVYIRRVIPSNTISGL